MQYFSFVSWLISSFQGKITPFIANLLNAQVFYCRARENTDAISHTTQKKSVANMIVHDNAEKHCNRAKRLKATIYTAKSGKSFSVKRPSSVPVKSWMKAIIILLSLKMVLLPTHESRVRIASLSVTAKQTKQCKSVYRNTAPRNWLRLLENEAGVIRRKSDSISWMKNDSIRLPYILIDRTFNKQK